MKEKIKVNDKDHLAKLIKKEIKKNGYNCNLNHLDISNLTDLSYVFAYSSFNGNISDWDTINVENMSSMFLYTKFKGNLSKWNTINVRDISYMFANSEFNGDISAWNVSNVKTMLFMFQSSKFNGSLSNWDISKVENIYGIFEDSKFERYDDLNNWKPFNMVYNNNIFNDKDKNKQVYWSCEHINLKYDDVKNSIYQYWAEKEKQLLIKNINNSFNLINKKDKFKI